ncbi:unnamed protein product [Lathyrus oleraceus]
MRKNMIQILIFIYALSIFLSPFLVEIKGDVIPCISHFDCPAKFPLKMKCIDEFCHLFSALAVYTNKFITGARSIGSRRVTSSWKAKRKSYDFHEEVKS